MHILPIVLFPVSVAYTSPGTYFGTRDEYNALNFEQRLSQNATVSVSVLDDWLGIVGNWAETEALKIVGGIVRLISKAIDMSDS